MLLRYVSSMGSEYRSDQGQYVEQLADHARQLQREARTAIENGDYRRASALIGDAEMLAGDVHDLVDDIEENQTDTMMRFAAEAEADAAEQASSRKSRLTLPPPRVRMALGTSIAMSLALTEC